MTTKSNAGDGGRCSGEAKQRHITATDRADAERLREILLQGPRETIVPMLARFLADKREEWIACALVRAERMYQFKARKVPKGMPSGGDSR